MRNRTIVLVVLATLGIATVWLLLEGQPELANGAVRGFETESVILYQSDPVLRERLPSPEDL
ncbi:MAG TPA: hypothetical protein VH394_02260, partial [Thermoanaerobaculia bacterium]|nr:hypothetical protein [Thermoanaerobaculia bacterium]